LDREQVVQVDASSLPPDAVFKGYEDVVVQDVIFRTDNVLFHKEKFYSPSQHQTYLASLPQGYRGQFGPGIKSLALVFYFGAQMSEPKLPELFRTVRVQISDVLTSHRPRCFLVNEEALGYVEAFGLSAVRRWQVRQLPCGVSMAEATLQALLETHLPGLGPQQRKWILDATAVAAYHAALEFPVVRLLVCDDAPQFTLVTEELA